MSSQTPAYFSLLAGASAGAVESFVTFPTEFVKTSAQLRSAGGRATTPVSIFKETWRNKGITGFYAGCAPVVAGNALKAGVRFLTYDTVRDALRDSNGKITPVRTVLAGICAGAIESIVAVTPSESIKTRLIENRRAATGSIPAGTLETIGALVRDEGVLSLWQGLAPTMMKQCANSAVRFSAYQGLKDLVLSARSTTQLDSLSTMAIGSTAGIITVYATQPFDTVKTRQQSRTAYKSSLQAFTKILTQEGPATFWRGSSPRVLRLLISGSISFLVYEEAMKVLKAM